MSAAENKAVFLSYASQDAEAARRICDALRAAGVEVWFDQNEPLDPLGAHGLVGGDAWDAKIRKQIKECALFVPIISAATQARTEGYFRLEWRIADQRTHLMAKGRPFLLPVVIDATRDSDAHVPDSFLEVQWTKLRGASDDRVFAERVRTVLAGPTPTEASRGASAGGTTPGTPAARAKRGRRAVIALGATAVLAGALAWFVAPRRGAAEASSKVVSSATHPLSEAQALVARARQLLDEGDELNRENYFFAEDLLKRATVLDPTEAAAWTLQARLSYLLLWHNIDVSEARREAMRRQAERAQALDPQSTEVQIVSADARIQLREQLAETERDLNALLAREPRNWRALRSLGTLYRFTARPEESVRAYRQARDLAANSIAIGDLVNALMRAGRWAEAQAELESSAGRSSAARLRCFSLYLKTQWQGDLPAARADLAAWPDWLRVEDRGAILAWRTLLWAQRPEEALAATQRLQRDYLRDTFFNGPREVLSALAHEAAGHAEAALADWRLAARSAERELAAAPTDVAAAYWKAWALARIGDVAGAQAVCAQLQQRNHLTLPDDPRVPINRIKTAVYFGSPGAAALWANVGRRDLALAELRRMKGNGFFAADMFPLTRELLARDPAFAPLRSEPEFAGILAAAPAPSEAMTEKSVAVLPFANLSGDPQQDYFSDGLTVEIHAALSNERDLRVPGTTSVFAFKGRAVPAPEIARALNVAQVVEGSVRKNGDQVKITVSLTRGADGFSEPLGSFTEKLQDVFALQEKVARAVVEKITKRNHTVGVAVLTKVPAAYDAYLRGRSAQMQSQRLWRQAHVFYEQATQLDPGFALAWARLAEVRFADYRSGIDRSTATLASIQAALNQALLLQPDLPTALVVRASIARVAREDLVAAEADLDRAGRLQSALPEVRFAQAYVARDRGDWPAAFRLAREGLTFSPRDGDMANVMAFIFWNRGDYFTADRLLVQAVEAADAGVTAAFQNRVNLRNRWRGPAAALRLWEATAKGRSDSQFIGVHLLVATGRRDEAMRRFAAMEGAADWTAIARSGSFLPALRMLQILGRDSLARQLAEQWRGEFKARLERGDTGHYTRANFISCEIALGHTESAARELERWKGDAAKLRSAYRQFDEFQERAAPLYAWMGDSEGAITTVRDYLGQGFQPGYLLKYSLAFTSLEKDPRWSLLADRAEAWAKAQPDPIDP